MKTRAQPKKQISEFNKLIRKAIAALIVGVPLFIVSMLGYAHVSSGLDQVIWIVIGIIVFVVMWYAGGHFFVAAWASFKAHSANMNTLIALATGPAWIYSMLVAIWPSLLPALAREVYFDAPMTVIGLLVLGAAIEMRAGEKAEQAISEAQETIPQDVTLLQGDEQKLMPRNEIKVGDQLIIKANATIPIDGKIIKGSSQVNMANLTGEIQLQNKHEADSVYAGSINVGHELIIEVTKLAENSTLNEIIACVRKAQNSKPSISQIADKIATVFAPIVLIAAFITLLIWMNFGPQPIIAYMLVTFMAVLLIACPCALGLAAPISCSVAISKAAQSGNIFHNSNTLSELPKLNFLVLTHFMPDTKLVVQAFAKHGVKTFLLVEQGDVPGMIDESIFEYVGYDLSDDDKIKKIYGLQQAGSNVAVLMNASEFKKLGLNDKVMRVTVGLDGYALDDVDISVLRKSLIGFLDAYVISKSALRNIKQNLTGAFLYNVIGIPIAAGVFYPLLYTLLSPILAGALMAGSSLSVIANANRLQLLKPIKREDL